MTPPPNIRALLAETVEAVREYADLVPRVGVVVGAQLAGFSERLRKSVRIPYGSLPHLPTIADGTGGDLSLGFVDDVPVACLEGRARAGAGVPTWQVVHGVRTLARLGVKSVLIAEEVGLLDPTWNVGDMMVVVDHLNLSSHESLGGIDDHDARAGANANANEKRDFFFEPFPNMRTAYDPALRAELDEVVRTENLLSARIGGKTHNELVSGIYAGLPDPTYETPAQMRMLRALGAHAVGVATPLEVVALRQLGVRVVALSHLSYRAASDDAPDIDETTSSSSLTHFHVLVRGWILRADRL